MYYLSRHTVRNPAEAPHLQRPNEKHEWAYGQQKHLETIRTMRGAVDQSVPESVNPAAQRTQIRTRQFYVDARRVEIARENRKLVGRLESIAKGGGGDDPRAPPRQKSLTPSTSFATSSGGLLAGAGASAIAAHEKSKSLNDLGRRKMQKVIDHDNASMVRRILACGPVQDRKAETRAFQKHKRAVHNLMRLPEAGASRKRSLSPQRVPRLSKLGNASAPALKGLDCIFMPSELTWVGGGSKDGADYDDYGDDGGYDDHGPFGHQRDDETERRSWVADGDDYHSPTSDRGADRSRTQHSGDFGGDEWDDGSFSADR